MLHKTWKQQSSTVLISVKLKLQTHGGFSILFNLQDSNIAIFGMLCHREKCALCTMLMSLF